MLCEKCKLRDATVHLTEILKSVKSEIHLCETCAKEFGLNTKFSKFSFTVPDMLSFLDVHEVNDAEHARTCLSCGTTYLDIRKKGRIGCPDCYRYLNDDLESIIMNLHGRSRHVGKIPSFYVEMKSFDKPLIDSVPASEAEFHDIENLRRKLEDAVMNEHYEDAARYRDMIRGLHKQKQGN